MSEVEISTRRNAAKRQEQIRHVATTFAEAKAKLIALVQEAKESNDHLALGYASWTAYLADTFGDEPLRLARDDRQDMVRVLAAEGMSTRAIAPIVDVPRETVRRWRTSGDPNGSPEQTIPAIAPATRPLDPARVEQYKTELQSFRAEATAAEASLNTPEPPKVTGLDGKMYARPASQKVSEPHRDPLPDQFFNAVYDLGKVVARIERLALDDRFPRTRSDLSLSHLSNIQRNIETLTAIASKLGD